MRERADYVCKYIGYWSSGHDICKIKRYAKVNTLFGIKDVKDDDGLQGDYGNGCSKQGRWGITICPMDESSSRDYTVNVKITYYALFYNRNDVLDS